MLITPGVRGGRWMGAGLETGVGDGGLCFDMPGEGGRVFCLTADGDGGRFTKLAGEGDLLRADTDGEEGRRNPEPGDGFSASDFWAGSGELASDEDTEDFNLSMLRLRMGTLGAGTGELMELAEAVFSSFFTFSSSGEGWGLLLILFKDVLLFFSAPPFCSTCEPLTADC